MFYTLRLDSRLIEIPHYRVCVVLFKSTGGDLALGSTDITALEKRQGVYKGEDGFRPSLMKTVISVKCVK